MSVVLLHAGVADRRSWDAVVTDLRARGIGADAYDRRGFGSEPASSEPFRHVDDLLARLEGPTWLVGSSMGGAVALDAAIEAPELVAGLVLIAPAVSGAPYEELAGEPDPAVEEIGRAMEAADEAGDVDELNRLEVRFWLDGPSSPEGRVGGAARELALDMNAIALRSGAAEDAGDSGVDAWSRLGEVRAPATVVWGDLDEPTTLALCRALAGRLPELRAAIELPGVAHLPMLERPREIAAIIASAVG